MWSSSLYILLYIQYAFLLVIIFYVDQPFLNNNYFIHKLKDIQFPVSVHVSRLFACCQVLEHAHTHMSSSCNTLLMQTHSKTANVWSWPCLLVWQKPWCMWWCILINACSATCFHSPLQISIIQIKTCNPFTSVLPYLCTPTLLLKQSVTSLQWWGTIWRICQNFQSTTGHLPSCHFFGLNSISSSLLRLFHIKHPTRCPRSWGPCPWNPSPGKGLTWAPAPRRDPGTAKGFHIPPSLKACSLPSIALIHFSRWHTSVQN